MSFNVHKCEVLHIVSNNDHINYSVNGSKLVKVTEEIDLGVKITSEVFCSVLVTPS